MLKIIAVISLLSQAVFALTPAQGEKLVTDTFQNLTINTASNYCIQSSMTCRSLYTYKNKTTGDSVTAFSITFYSAERQVGASEYYIPTGKGNWFYRIVDVTYDGKLNVERADETQQVRISNDGIIIQKLYMPKLGTTEYIESDLVFGQQMAYLDGALKDKNDSSANKPVRIEYPFLSSEVRK